MILKPRDNHHYISMHKLLGFLNSHVKLFKKLFYWSIVLLGFPGSSTGKEYICNSGDLGLIPGSERSPGEGIGYPLQYSQTSLVAHTVTT